jgi:hypothetical protein
MAGFWFVRVMSFNQGVIDSYVPPLSSMRSIPAASSSWQMILLSPPVKPLREGTWSQHNS